MRTENRSVGLRRRLVQTLRRKGIRNEAILKAFADIPRHRYMPEASIEFAYKDLAYEIGAGQTISQPYTVAVQTHLLDIEIGDKVLEIGTGSGFQASILAYLGAKVYTIERQESLYHTTSQLLHELGFGRIRTLFGDGYAGSPRFAPFDKIIITCGATHIPNTLLNQLRIGGIMIIPLGEGDNKTMLRIQKTSESTYTKTSHGTFSFVPFLQGVSARSQARQL